MDEPPLPHDIDSLTFCWPPEYPGGKTIDCPSREVARHIIQCLNACRGLNPEHVPELVKMVERVAQLLLFDTFEDAADRENIQRQCGTDALALLARVKQ